MKKIVTIVLICALAFVPLAFAGIPGNNDGNFNSVNPCGIPGDNDGTFNSVNPCGIPGDNDGTFN